MPSKEYYEKNRESIKAKNKLYRDANKLEIAKKKKVYNADVDNKEHRNKYKRESNKKRYYSDDLFRLKCNLRSLFWKSFKDTGFTKKSKTNQLLGCSYEDFKKYIESKFEPWMSWDNRSLYNGELNYGWDIDHIVPTSSATCEEDLIRLNHYTNLQPLCSKINQDIKRNKHPDTQMSDWGFVVVPTSNKC